MKKCFVEPRYIFTLLMIASVIAILAGAHLGVTLGMQVQASVTVLSAVGILLWMGAWGAFMMMCSRLRKGESAFSVVSGKTLRTIGWCMVGLAAVTVTSAVIGGSRANTSFWLIEFLILPGIFLAVAVVATILQRLLIHAIALEEEQEGVV